MIFKACCRVVSAQMIGCFGTFVSLVLLWFTVAIGLSGIPCLNLKGRAPIRTSLNGVSFGVFICHQKSYFLCGKLTTRSQLGLIWLSIVFNWILLVLFVQRRMNQLCMPFGGVELCLVLERVVAFVKVVWGEGFLNTASFLDFVIYYRSCVDRRNFELLFMIWWRIWFRRNKAIHSNKGEGLVEVLV